MKTLQKLKYLMHRTVFALLLCLVVVVGFVHKYKDMCRHDVISYSLYGGDARHDVISYSLYGGDARYMDGALANAKLYKAIYPCWTMRVYHDHSVPEHVLRELRDSSVEMVNMTGSPLNKMSWRFLPASDSTVRRFCARDVDSRLSAREKAAVDAWVSSGRKFHVMRDHPSHSLFAMSGGMWCATHDAVPDMEERLNARLMTHDYLQDMNFLNEVIWPIAQHDVLQHDAFSCDKFGGGVPFPTVRKGWEHVGSVYINGEIRQGDVDILKKATVVEKCVVVKKED